MDFQYFFAAIETKAVAAAELVIEYSSVVNSVEIAPIVLLLEMLEESHIGGVVILDITPRVVGVNAIAELFESLDCEVSCGTAHMAGECLKVSKVRK